ncbi:MAG TPA: hypothetical protein VMT67_04700 [Terriglobales bacterium]|nr:hypothetical protein [Terriglobales bacterium]
MAEALEQAQHEFWRPPAKAAEVTITQDRSETCSQCGSEFIVGSRFCHSCGASRKEVAAAQAIEVPGVAELTALGKLLGLPKAALAAFLFGLFCVVGALAVGIIFTAHTPLDWQAIQLWRIEWLLGAIASFGAGLLLKKAA